jgi:8-oxo-dGTP diphosphatase
VHVAAGVLANTRGEVLIARRPVASHLGGLWEFPGGKVETGEAMPAALVRELREELGVEIGAARPLIAIDHHYPDKRVFLDVWRVIDWRGEPHGREGQPLAWIAPQDLPGYPMPAADRPVITALRLPPLYLITPDPGADIDPFLRRLESCLAAGVRLLQLRANSLASDDYAALAANVIPLCRVHGCQVLLNSEPERVESLGGDGVHLSSARLRAAAGRPLPASMWVAASCHDADEVVQAGRIGADFIVLGPVQETHSHAGMPALGWERYAALAAAAPMPVYALGGMQPGDMTTAWDNGAQGLAMISGIWNSDDPRSVLQSCGEA